MRSRNSRVGAAASAILITAVVVAVGARQATTVGPPSAAVDEIFSKWTPATPGCAVGAAVDGETVLSKAYGMADLEHDVPNAPDTIFEAGSVSKQFTAAAVLLLARDGKLSLDDPVRKYIPEMPAYDTRGIAAADGRAPATFGPGEPTIRQMLNHTSGLRDWGSVEAIAGWPRTTRVYTHAHVLDIVSRQHALNFPAGTRWSYSNTGFNLSAIIVSRVSGQPFAEFSKQRIFGPLGMTRTSWRDDHTRIVKGRAVAYRHEKDGFHIEMPFEDIHGNGGLLTSVGDLLKWNENFVSPIVGDRAFVDQQQQPGHFKDGRQHDYGFGLYVGLYKGVREVSHSGSTAGYRAFLTRFPDQHVSVAVLCNAANANPTEYAHNVADLLLGEAERPLGVPPHHPPADLDGAKGLYRSVETGLPVRIGGESNPFHDGETWRRDAQRRLHVTDRFGREEIYERTDPVLPDAERLREYVGNYWSADAETMFTVAVDGDTLVVKRRPDTTIRLTPVYADAFRSHDFQLVIFHRNAANRPTSLSVVESRVWNMPFVRQ